MKSKLKIAAIFGISILFATVIANADSISAISPFFFNSSGQITQRTANTPIVFSGLTPGGCLQLTSQNVATTTGNPCGSGGGSASSTLLMDNNTFSGLNIFATATISSLNSVIYVTGSPYAQSCAGIQNAINAASNGATVSLVQGIYPCASGFNFAGKSIRLIGQGASSTILRASAGFSGFALIYDFVGSGSVPNNRPNIEIANVGFDANYQHSVSAIQMGSSKNLNIHNILVMNVKDIWGVNIGSIGGTLGSETSSDYSQSASNNLNFSNNEIASSTFGTNEGVLCVNCRNYTISNNYFHDLTQGPASLAVYVGSQNGLIIGNKYASSTIRDFYSSGVDDYLYQYNSTFPATSTVTARGIQVFNTTHARIENNNFNGQNDGFSGSGGITIYDYNGPIDGHNISTWATTTDIFIDHNTFTNGYVGVSMSEVSGSDKQYEKHNIFIENNTFTNMLYASVIVGTQGSTANDSTLNMSNIYIDGNIQVGASKGFGIGAFSVTGSTTNPGLVNTVFIHDNYATTSSVGGTFAGIYVDGASGVKIYNNNVDGTAKGGWSDIQVTANTSNITQENISSTCISFAGSCVTNPWSSSGSKIYYAQSGGFVGVGTTTPDFWFTINPRDFTTTLNLLHIGNSIDNYGGQRVLIENAWGGNEGANASLMIQANASTPRFTVTGAGRVGVASSSPDSGASLNYASGRSYLHVGDNQNIGTTKILVENGWTGSGVYGILVQRNASTPQFAVDGTGNIGISTSTPGTKLSIGVSGDASGINFSLATSTFENAGGINLTTGCFAINGSCIGSGSASTTLLSDSNTWTKLQNFSNASTTLSTQTTSWIGTLNLTNALSIANGGTATTTQVTNGVNYFDGTRITSGTALTFDGSKLGVSSSTPSATLSLGGNLSLNKNNGIALDGSNSTSGAFFSFDGSAIRFARGSGIIFRINSGNVVVGQDGFGSSKLSVNGNTSIGAPFVGISAPTDGLIVAGNTGIGTSSPGAILSIAETASSTPNTPIILISTSTQATTGATTTVFSIDNVGNTIIGAINGIFSTIKGWIVTSGKKPTTSSCGTTSVVSGNQTSGDVMITGTLVTTCTINWPNPVPSGTTLQCTVSDNSLTGFSDVAATTTSSITVGISTGLSAVTIYWNCHPSLDSNG